VVAVSLPRRVAGQLTNPIGRHRLGKVGEGDSCRKKVAGLLTKPTGRRRLGKCWTRGGEKKQPLRG